MSERPLRQRNEFLCWGIQRANVVAGEFAREALEAGWTTGNEELPFLPVAGVERDVDTRRVGGVVLPRYVWQRDPVDVDLDRVAAPPDVHYLRFEREEVPHRCDQLRSFPLEQIRSVNIPFSVQFGAAHLRTGVRCYLHPALVFF